MVGPGETTALRCRWHGTLAGQRLGEPPGVSGAGAGQEKRAGGHGGGGGPPGGGGAITPARLADAVPGCRVSVSWGSSRAHRGGPQAQARPGPGRRVLADLAEQACLRGRTDRTDRTGRVTAAGPVAGWHAEAVLPELTAAPS